MSRTNTKGLIRQAITDQHQLKFNYKGHSRTVIPVALGICRTNKDWRMRAYQMNGTSVTKRIGPDWPKIWVTAHMKDIEVLETTFDVPQKYRRGDKSLDIDTEL